MLGSKPKIWHGMAFRFDLKAVSTDRSRCIRFRNAPGGVIVGRLSKKKNRFNPIPSLV